MKFIIIKRKENITLQCCSKDFSTFQTTPSIEENFCHKGELKIAAITLIPYYSKKAL